MKKLRVLMVAGLIFSVSLLMMTPVYAGHGKGGRDYRFRYQRYPRRGIRFTGRDIDRLIIIGGIYFLTRAISEARKPEVVYVYPPPPQYIYVPSPQPTYTPVVPISTVTVRNVTNWYIVVGIKGMQLNLYPGYEQVVSWIYTGTGQYIEAQAFLDSCHQQLVGTYRGNLVGYQIPWRLNFDYGSFAIR